MRPGAAWLRVSTFCRHRRRTRWAKIREYGGGWVLQTVLLELGCTWWCGHNRAVEKIETSFFCGIGCRLTPFCGPIEKVLNNLPLGALHLPIRAVIAVRTHKPKTVLLAPWSVRSGAEVRCPLEWHL